jgi:glycosyltransferase involved in cell wall biosynthesis
LTGMHVVVAGWTFGTGPSGATRRQVELLRALPPHLRDGERVTVLVEDPSLGAPRPYPDVPCPVLPLPAPHLPTWRRVLAERRHLARALRTLHADVLDLGTLPVHGRLPCPVVLTVHDLREDHPDFARRSGWFQRWVLARALRRAQRVVVPSLFTAETLRRAFPKQTPPIDVVPNGVDRAFLDSRPQRAADPYLLHVGHLEPRKDLEFLVEVHASLTGPAKAAQLVLVGQDLGSGASIRAKVAELGTVDRVQLVGTVDEDRLLDLYAGAHAVVVPSRYEGFGLPALEGLAVGVPTLVADTSALPEVTGGRARLLPARDRDAWVRAIEAILGADDDPSEVAGRKEQAARFSWDRAAAGMVRTWRAAAARG